MGKPMDIAPPSALEEEASDTFFRLLNKIAWGRRYPRDYGTGELLFMGEAEVLDRVGSFEHTTVTRLADLLGVSKPAVSTMTRKLEKKGYLRKTAAPDGKTRLLTLTPTGATARQGFRAYRDQLHHYLAGVGDDALGSHIEVMRRMERFIDDLHAPLKNLEN